MTQDTSDVRQVQSVNQELLEALKDLYDEQNSAPLLSRVTQWNNAMSKAKQAIARAEQKQLVNAELASAMSMIYEEERAKYVGGVVYYPNNQEAFKGAMLKAIARAYLKLQGG